jgi:hypothetical protein
MQPAAKLTKAAIGCVAALGVLAEAPPKAIPWA